MTIRAVDVFTRVEPTLGAKVIDFTVPPLIPVIVWLEVVAVPCPLVGPMMNSSLISQPVTLDAAMLKVMLRTSVVANPNGYFAAP